MGEPVVLEELASGDTLVRFLTVDLAVIERRTGMARPQPGTSRDTEQDQPEEVSPILTV